MMATNEDDWIHQRVCNRCGKGGLMWEEETSGKWILYDSHTGEVHKCSKNKIVPLNELLNQKL